MTSRGANDANRISWIIDPRETDFPEDGHLWRVLLARAYDLDGNAPDGLFGGLHGVRCLGARLESGPEGVRLRPGDIDRAEYLALRKRYLKPWSSLLSRLLIEVAMETHPVSKHAPPAAPQVA